MAKHVNTITVTGTLTSADLNTAPSKNTGRDMVRGNLVINTGTVDAPNEVKVNVLQMADKKDKKNEGQMIPDSRYNDLIKLTDPEAIGTKISVSGSIDNNVFVPTGGDLVKGTSLSGGFYNIPGTGRDQASFRMTMVIKSVKPEVDREENETGSYIVQGIGFTFRNVAIPVKFYVDSPEGIGYFTSNKFLTAVEDGGVYTDVWGKIVNEQVAPKTEESAFGDAYEVSSNASFSRRVITGTAVKHHNKGTAEDPNDFTKFNAMVKEANEAYQVLIAEAIERSEKPASAPASAPASKPVSGGFNF